MKLIVNNTFRDKEDHVTVYKPGTILEVKDKERAADLVNRGLCAEYKGKKKTTVTLGDDTPAVEGDAGTAPELPAAETSGEVEKPKSEKE